MKLPEEEAAWGGFPKGKGLLHREPKRTVLTFVGETKCVPQRRLGKKQYGRKQTRKNCSRGSIFAEKVTGGERSFVITGTALFRLAAGTRCSRGEGKDYRPAREGKKCYCRQRRGIIAPPVMCQATPIENGIAGEKGTTAPGGSMIGDGYENVL